MTVPSFIATQRTVHGVPHAAACRALDVPGSTFYKWRDKAPTATELRRADI
jgi:putative transposase